MEEAIEPILSIVIATRNRVIYCINTIETILKFQDKDFELVIQDNSDNFELYEFISTKVADKRLKYYYVPTPLSFTDNFNEGIEKAKGEYVCSIGDDDVINHEIFELVRWASSMDIEAIVPQLNVLYRWPSSGIIFKPNEVDNGILEISKITGRLYLYKTKKEIERLIQNGGQSYLQFNLAKLYHGIVRKECLDKIKAATGKYFGGLSPDIYISVALTLFVDRILKLDYPLTISGMCNKSGSADSVTGKHTGKLEDAPHLKGHDQYSWAKQVPKFYSVETIWADSAIAALTDLDRYDLVQKFNNVTLTVLLLKGHRDYSKIILKHYFDYMSTNKTSKLYSLVLLILKFLEIQFFKYLSGIIRRISNNKATYKSFENINNISQAEEKLTSYLAENNLSVGRIINKQGFDLNNLIGN